MTVAHDIKTYFDSDWLVVNAAKPTIIEGEYKTQPGTLPILFVEDGPATLDHSRLAKLNKRGSPFTLVLQVSFATHLATIREIMRLIAAKSITSGFWEILNVDTKEANKYTEVFFVGQELKLVAESSW